MTGFRIVCLGEHTRRGSDPRRLRGCGPSAARSFILSSRAC
jgi:hypothetical protein